MAVNVAELAYVAWTADEEKARQDAVALCRQYFDGTQDSYLSGTQRAFLNIPAGVEFWLNVFRTVVDSVTERLVIDGVSTTRAIEAKSETDLSKWAGEVWTVNKGQLLHATVHEMAARDGEAFVIVDYDAETSMPRFTVHQRFVDAQYGGDGFGCKAHYEDDDTDAPMLYASKRWIEQLDARRTRNRMTLYFPDRIEKYFWNGGDWLPFEEEEGGAVLPWVDAAGAPLGIPVIHFRNTQDLRSEAWDAIPLQRAINKTLVDLMGAADLTGFQMYFAAGFHATTDGQPLRTDGSNALKVGGGQLIGTDRPARDADFREIKAGDLKQLIDLMQSLIGWLAVVTSTPESRLSFTRQIAAEGTLQEQKEGLFAKIRKRQALFDESWRACFDMGRKLANVNGGSYDTDAAFLVQWQPVQSRDTTDERDEWRAKKELGVPLETIWQEMGYDAKEIATMKATDEYRARVAMMELGLNSGNG